jgi:hypothetical protein
MTRRHYGIRVPKPRPTYTGPARAGAWSGSAFISVIVVILIVLGVILYGLSKTTANTTTSAPHTTGQGSPGSFGGMIPRRALAAISPIVDSSERGDSQNVDRNLDWLGHAYRFALGRWIGAVVTDGRDTRGSRVPRRHHVPARGGQL